MTIHQFPARVTRLSPREQREVAQVAKANQVLAAIVRKYPEIRLTTDEIVDATGYQPTVQWVHADAEWAITTYRKPSRGEQQ